MVGGRMPAAMPMPAACSARALRTIDGSGHDCQDGMPAVILVLTVVGTALRELRPARELVVRLLSNSWYKMRCIRTRNNGYSVAHLTSAWPLYD